MTLLHQTTTFEIVVSHRKADPDDLQDRGDFEIRHVEVDGKDISKKLPVGCDILICEALEKTLAKLPVKGDE